MNTEEIFNKYIGKPVEAEDPSNIDQCMDWAFKYCDEIGVDRGAIRHLFAYQAFTMPNDLTLKFFDYIPNTPLGKPQLGDIVIFGTGVGVAGHIAVVESADTSGIKSLDQNWNGHKYVERITHPYDNVLGWLHPHSAISAQNPAQPVITDQTKIPQIDNQEVQAIHSMLMDLNRDLDNTKRELAEGHEAYDRLKTDFDKATSAQNTPKPADSVTFTNSLAKLLYSAALAIEGRSSE